MGKDRIWHPYTQHAVSETPLQVIKAEGAWLYLADGRKIIDGVSSWWVNTWGHGHPHIAAAIGRQARQLEHVMFAGFTHSPAEQLAERLADILPGKPEKIFFSDNGSTAVEVAVKIALQYWYNIGQPREHVLAFEQAYHGDTFGAMSVSGMPVFTDPYQPWLARVERLPDPSVTDTETLLAKLEQALLRKPAAFILEPLVLGAGGMKMYSPELLKRIAQACRAAGVPLIADEVMTGFGRTGEIFACTHAHVEPDLICLSKGLTGGFLPMGITACRQWLYDAFHSEDLSRTLFHGHSFTANPLACAAANASLDIWESEYGKWEYRRFLDDFREITTQLSAHPLLQGQRLLGGIWAAEVKGDALGYTSPVSRKLRPLLLEQGVLLRPLGNTVYILPPYCTEKQDLKMVADVLINALNQL